MIHELYTLIALFTLSSMIIMIICFKIKKIEDDFVEHILKLYIKHNEIKTVVI